ncbi:hypothetical protein KUTeg_021738 [Tegillarca granosa]|uniref:Uncharacterized protein n=1 Tax=Tegillarca granosa TaxID=220873 RepID=A0ABQ9E4H4_TEGGR|nr:hypothetical protein KUTeg_021738 [Tegillarca granosa]
MCGRPHSQLNVDIVDGNKNLFVCTKFRKRPIGGSATTIARRRKFRK